MATAAPAAPAPASAPPPGAPADIQAAPPKAVIKPIPPKGQDLGLHKLGADDLGITKAKVNRDDSGRFAPGSGPSPDAAPLDAAPATEDGVAAEPQPADADAPPAETPPPFAFAGQNFRDQAHAEQFLSTLVGQYRSMGEREQNAAKQAYAWQARAQALEQALSSGTNLNPGAPGAQVGAAASPHGASTPTGRGTSPSPASQPFTAADAERMLTDAVDMKIYQQILSKDGPGLAQVYLHQSNQEALRNVLGKVLEAQEQSMDSKLAPFHEWAQQMSSYSTTSNLFNEATSATDEGGQPFFPELRDPAARAGIADVWLGMLDKGIAESFLMSPEGVHMAVSLYRDVAGYQRRRNGSPPPSPAPVNDGGFAAQVAQAVAQRASGNAVAPGARSQTSPSDAALPPHKAAARRIANANLYDPITGVRATR